MSRAHERGYGADTEAGEIVGWLADDFGLGRGHAMALAQVVEKGAVISDEHVGTAGVHRDASTELYLDGKANRHLHEPDGAG